ncbi:MAG: LemA protein [Bacteroidia bacterium]|nr:MAG: LemA protein [Bacteroidia bacterium]
MGLSVVLVGVLLLVCLLLWFVLTMNSLIAKRNRVRQCESGISVVLKQRHDLIPNLVAIARQYQEYEQGVMVRMAELRAKVYAPGELPQRMHDARYFSGLLASVRATAEDYPELQANGQFLKLMDALRELEDELQAMRRTYNAAATRMNNAVEMFPSSIVARSRGYRLEPLVEVEDTEKLNLSMGELLAEK